MDIRRFAKLTPTQFLVIGYLIIITIGAFLLYLPVATVPGGVTKPLDALFTATSATAVTGLIVVSTVDHWSIFGQVVIMLLVQIGGFGFMTTSTLLMMVLGKRMGLRERLILVEEKNAYQLVGIVRLVRYVVMLTLFIEGVGALLLFSRFIGLMSFKKAIFYSVFHSISAFNNAGFDLFGNSLENFTTDWYLILIISALLIVGGTGFTVIFEIYRCRSWKRFSLHTKVVLLMTGLLITLGTAVVFAFEYNNPETLGQLGLNGKLAGAYFQGVVPRTAGFNSVPIGRLREGTLFFMAILMFIGASPGSTGGGVKTTTFGTLLMVLWGLIRNQGNDIVLFERRLAQETIFKALAVVMMGVLLIISVTMILTLTEQLPFIDLLFETVSAFGTVGLSTGITGELSSPGQLFVIIMMFIGRVGPMTLAVALGEKRTRVSIRYPEEKLMIG